MFTVSTWRYGVEFMVAVTLVPVLIVWIPRMAWVASRQPSRRAAQRVKFGIVVSMIIALTVFNGVQERQARAAAEHVIDVITAYRAQHGAYPVSLGQAGIDARPLRKWWLGYYSEDGRTSLYYGTALSALDTYFYEFDKPGWQFHPD